MYQFVHEHLEKNGGIFSPGTLDTRSEIIQLGPDWYLPRAFGTEGLPLVESGSPCWLRPTGVNLDYRWPFDFSVDFFFFLFDGGLSCSGLGGCGL